MRKAIEHAKQKKEHELRFSDEGITELSATYPELFTLQHLTRLILSNNRITYLPPDIVQLSSLEYLSLFNNHLEDLPSTISSLTKLRELNVALNRLVELPRGFGTAPSLAILDLTYNNLSDDSFPGNFSYLGGTLRALYMGDNDLNGFPPSIEKFELLQVLVLRDNNITDVPAEVSKCSNLKTLHLQFNQINVVPPELARLTQFTDKNTSLRLNDNPLIHGLDEKYAINVRHFFEYIRSDDYRVALAEFKETNNYTKVKRDRSAKISRRSKRYRDKLLTDPPAPPSADN